MEALSWIGDLFRTFGQLFPRLEHVRANEVAVVFRRGEAAPLEPGLHWYWPIWSETQKYPSRRNDMDLREQILPTRDGKAVMVTVTIIYEVKDGMKALVDTYDLENTVSAVASGAVKQVVMEHDLCDLLSSQDKIDKEITKQARALLETYGLRIRKAMLTEGPVPARAFKHAGVMGVSSG